MEAATRVIIVIVKTPFDKRSAYVNAHHVAAQLIMAPATRAVAKQFQ
jgi:hypothetical protein